MRTRGTTPGEDAGQLFRRMAFNVLVSNVDDHMRNHGFLWHGDGGWRLSPAYDLNPVPQDVKARILSTNIDLEEGTCSLDLLRGSAGYFGLAHETADAAISEVAGVVAGWRQAAARRGAPAVEIDRMASAFEHCDLRGALAARTASDLRGRRIPGHPRPARSRSGRSRLPPPTAGRCCRRCVPCPTTISWPACRRRFSPSPLPRPRPRSASAWRMASLSAATSSRGAVSQGRIGFEERAVAVARKGLLPTAVVDRSPPIFVDSTRLSCPAGRASPAAAGPVGVSEEASTGRPATGEPITPGHGRARRSRSQPELSS